MAFWLLFTALAFYSAPAAASLCNVSCSTDYQESLNCSCSGAEPKLPVRLNVTCREETENVSGSCVIEPPGSWCVVRPDGFQLLLSVGTDCVTTTDQQEVTEWILSDFVKPRPPYNVQVLNSAKFYNIVWNQSSIYRLSFRIRIRTQNKTLHFLVPDSSTFYRVEREKLEHRGKFTVEVQAKVDEFHLKGSWSEWSTSTECRAAEEEEEEMEKFWLFAFLPVVFVLGLLVVGFAQKPFWQKKLQQMSFYPKPNEFFKPLYLDHGGNFKEWVKPAFNEYDYLRMVGDVAVEKHHGALQWSAVEAAVPAGVGEDGGRVSIHTVTLPGEDGSLSLRSYGEHSGYNRQQGGAHPQPEEEMEEDQGAFLMKNLQLEDQWGDAYPHVDLDTIDSGFGECSSPSEQNQSDPFQEVKNSNYVKQWMIDGTQT